VHTRRIATFLLGAWIAGSFWMAFLQIESFRFPDSLLSHPIPPASKIVQTIGREQAGQLLAHFAAEQVRLLLRLWGRIEVCLALALGVFLFRGTQKRAFPLFLCAIMLMLALFQYFALTPELTYQGRETDFPPRSNEVAAMARVLALRYDFAGMEIVKLIAGVILAGYLFLFRAPRRGRKETDALDPKSENAAHL
jgi:hypothetical protein